MPIEGDMRLLINDAQALRKDPTLTTLILEYKNRDKKGDHKQEALQKQLDTTAFANHSVATFRKKLMTQFGDEISGLHKAQR